MNDQVMTPEMRAQAMQMLGGGMVQQGAQALTGRQAQLQAQEAAAMGGGGQGMPPQPAQPPYGGPQQPSPYGGPVPTAAQQASPGMLRKLAEMLRGAGR
jgi:hypothetical protein